MMEDFDGFTETVAVNTRSIGALDKGLAELLGTLGKTGKGVAGTGKKVKVVKTALDRLAECNAGFPGRHDG